MISAADSSRDGARHLADLFASVGQDVDNYRVSHLRELTPKLRARLEDAVEQLEGLQEDFASNAVRRTLNEIADDLDEIAAVAAQASLAVKHLKESRHGGDLVGNLASSVAALALAIKNADSGSVPGALEDVTEALKQQSR